MDALNVAEGNHVIRFPCRVLGRDDQGELRCVAGKPTLDYGATEVLGSFARKCALDVAHLWDAPPVVKRYLRTGDKSIRAVARDAAMDAAWTLAAHAASAAAEAAGDAASEIPAWEAALVTQGASGGEILVVDRQARRLGRMLLAGGK